MKRYKLWLFITMATFSLASCDEFDTTPKQHKTYYGIQQGENGITLRSINIASKSSSTIATINGIKNIKPGVFTYDTQQDLFVLGTDQGITVINVRNNDVVVSFEGITEVEYNKNTGHLCGLSWDKEEKKWYFSHADHISGDVKRIKALNSFLTVEQGSATFDYKKNRYIFNSDRGLFALDANTGEIIITMQGVTNTEYNERNGLLIGLKTSNLKELIEINLDASEVVKVADISSIGGVEKGSSSFDPVNGYYVLKSNYGVTVVDYRSGNVIAKFPDLLQLAVLDKIILEIENGMSY